jgi:hypothetical protein
MKKKAVILVAACVMVVVVVFFVFFVFRTPTQQTTKDPYFAAYYNEFNKTPKLAYTCSFSPPVSMYHALLIALTNGGWNATSLRNRTISVELQYCGFINSSSGTGMYLIHPVTHSVVDWSPQQINATTTHRYVWTIFVGPWGGPVYYVDVSTAELVYTGGIIPPLL